MQFYLSFKRYQRSFQRPLQTGYGVWQVREGIIIRLVEVGGWTSFGEVAPLSWFGTESVNEAIAFCQQVASQGILHEMPVVPTHLPACQFGLESAWMALKAESRLEIGSQQTHQRLLPEPWMYSALLPTGEVAMKSWQSLWEQGFRTFKWKIGVAQIQEEIQTLQRLRKALPEEAQLRLDANAGLEYEQAIAYLQICDQLEIEFLEQPLPVNQLSLMLELSQKFRTPLALDESVATLQQLQACYEQGWRGIFVVKPAIAGSPSQLQQFCQKHELDIVCSSVFETPIGRQACLQLAAQLSCDRAVGFGVNHWFNDGLDQLSDFEQVWNRL